MNKHGDRVVDEAVMSAAGDASLCVVVCVRTSVRCRMTRRWVSKAIVCVYVSAVSAGRSVAEECEGVYRIWPWPTKRLAALQHSSPRTCARPTAAYHGMAWCYCIVLPRLTADACLVHAHAAVLRSSCRRPMQLQMHCASFGRSKHPPERTAPVQRRGPANTGGAAPGPLHRSGYGCIWISSWMSSAGLQLLTSRRGPGRREPLGYIGSHARPAYHGPVSPPVSPSRRTSGPIQCPTPAEQRGSHCCQARRRLITTAQRAPSRLVASRSLPSPSPLPLPFPST
jgi:hypothetical protein